MSQGINYAGDIVFERADLLGTISNNKAQGIDIRPQIMKMEIFESLFYPFTTAKIYVKDAIDLLNVVPIRGEEIINIVAYTPSVNKKLNFAFHVYKLSDKYQDKDRASVYTLHCISLEAFINTNRKFSRGFSGNIGNIVNNLLSNKDYGFAATKQAIVEPTANSIQYVSNYWSPLKNIQYLAEHAVSLQGNNRSYIFFENRDGYNFISLERLYDNPAIQVFTKDNMTSGTKQDVDSNYGKIQSYESIELFDYYTNSDEGVFSSSQINYDMLFKLYSDYEYVSTEDTKRKLLNKNLPYSNSLVTSTHNYVFDSVSHSNMFDGGPGGLIDDQARMSRLSRLSRLSLANYHALTITVTGRSDYTVGYVVELKIPRDAAISNSDMDSPWDPTLSGRYIISEINHSVDGSGHNCSMTLIKDSLQ